MCNQLLVCFSVFIDHAVDWGEKKLTNVYVDLKSYSKEVTESLGVGKCCP